MPTKFLSAQDALALTMAAKYGAEVSQRVKDYLTKNTKDPETRAVGLILLRGRVTASDDKEHVELANQLRERADQSRFEVKTSSVESDMPKVAAALA